MKHWTLTLGRSTRCLFLYLMVNGKLLGHRSCTLRRLRADWISWSWTSMRDVFSGLCAAKRVHVVRLKDVNDGGNGTEFTVELKSPEWSAKHIFPWSPLCPVANKGRKPKKMCGVVQQQKVAHHQNKPVAKLQPQHIELTDIWIGCYCLSKQLRQ